MALKDGTQIRKIFFFTEGGSTLEAGEGSIEVRCQRGQTGMTPWAARKDAEGTVISMWNLALAEGVELEPVETRGRAMSVNQKPCIKAQYGSRRHISTLISVAMCPHCSEFHESADTLVPIDGSYHSVDCPSCGKTFELAIQAILGFDSRIPVNQEPEDTP